MKTSILLFWATLSASAVFLWSCQRPAPDAAVEEALYRAAPGDTVWIILNHVKPDQRESFETFLEEVLRPALEQSAAQDSLYMNLLTRARRLYPTRQNQDSTYTYIYLVERYIPGDYSYRRLLSAVYTPEQTEEYLRIPGEALARPQESYFVVQSW